MISKILTGDELRKRLAVLPAYDPAIRNADAGIRLDALDNIYHVFVPTAMSMEIYTRICLAIRSSLKKKSGKEVVAQRYANHKLIMGGSYQGIVGGSDSFTIVGTPGIGKSVSIARSIEVITSDGVNTGTEGEHADIIPCLTVQCPFDCSAKGMLLSILQNVDSILESKYHENALRSRATTDMLIGCVSTVAMNRIGLIIVDEIQNVIGHRGGLSLINMLTQLINASGVAICMVGVPASLRFFETEMYLARRTVGLQYEALPYDEEFACVCRTLLSYCYTAKSGGETSQEGVIRWLYEHSGGVLGIVTALLHDAQEIAILGGEETLGIPVLNQAFRQRSAMLRNFINPTGKKGGTTKRNLPAGSVATHLKEKTDVELPEVTEDMGQTLALTISAVSTAEKQRGATDIVEALRKYMTVEEVAL